MKLSRSLIRIVSIALALVLVSCSTPQNKDQNIKIGIIASQTGAAAEQGQSWLKGALLAYSLLDQSESPVELFIEDDSTEAKSAVSAFQSLSTVSKVDAVIGGTWDFLALSIIPLSEAANIPLIMPSNPIELYSKYLNDRHNLLVTGLSLAAEKEALSQLIIDKKWKTVAVIVVDVPYGLSHGDMVGEISANSDLKIVYSSKFSLLSNYADELKVRVAQARASNPDFIFCVTDAVGVDLVLKELEKDPPLIPLVVTQHLENAFKVSGSAARYKEAYGIYPKLEDPSFIELYKAQYEEAPKVYAAEGFDALNFAYRTALVRKNSTRGKDLFPMKGVTGQFEYPPINNQPVKVKAEMMTTKNGVFESVELSKPMVSR